MTACPTDLGKVTLSASEIEMLLWHATHPGTRHPELSTDANDAVPTMDLPADIVADKLCTHGLLAGVVSIYSQPLDSSYYVLTPRGHAFIKQLLSTPLPQLRPAAWLNHEGKVLAHV